MKILMLSVLASAAFSDFGHAKSAPQILPPRMSDSAGSFAQIADTIRVVAIRVEFAPDTMSGTTGDGSFGSGIADTFLVDPLPHNRRYFSDQLLFLKNFYEKHSNGEIFLDITDAVYPLDDGSVYQLPYPMWHYNHNDDDYLDYGLAALFYDSWKAADTQDDDIDFPPYDPNNYNNDLYIVFHAGVGKDFAFDYDPTPFDIPSAYINYQDLADALPDSITIGQGISVDDGAAFVREGIILPECENQEGYELGMHGHMVLLFGHHIGLKNLYNTDDGTTVLGWFGMMDQGSGKLDGLIPAPPSAWTKVHAGWAEVQEVSSFPSTVEVPVGTIIKVPITDSEYYLVENIDSWVRPEVSWDSLSYSFYVEYNDYPRTFELLRDSVSQYMTVEIDPVSGVLTDIDNWGVGRPASGLLIWHIDEEVINVESYGSLSSYGINNNPDHLGVFLEEADGAMDIGQDYTLFSAGYGTELGYPWDAFWGDNKYHKEANPHKNGAVSFGDDTFPDAKSNSGALSHLVFSDFSMVIADTMSFTVDNDLVLPGFPIRLDSLWSADLFAANILDYSDLGMPDPTKDELIAFKSGEIFVWQFGTISGSDPVPVKENGILADHFYSNDGTIKNLMAANLDDDSADELLIFTLSSSGDSFNILDYDPADSTVTVTDQIIADSISPNWNNQFISANDLFYYNMQDELYCYEITDNQFNLLWQNDLPASSWYLCEMPGDGVFLTSKYIDNIILHYSSDGNLVWQSEIPVYYPDEEFYSLQPASGDIDRDGEVEVAFFAFQTDYTANNMYVYLAVIEEDGSIKEDFPVIIGNIPMESAFTTSIELIDIDDDGYLNFVFSTEDGGIQVYDHNGVRSDYFPYAESFSARTILSGKSSTAGGAELIFQNFDGIDACDSHTDRIADYPIAKTRNIFSDGMILLEAEPDEFLLAAASGYNINAYNTGLTSIDWGMAYRDKRHSSYVETLYTPLPQSGSLMPSSQVYNWPNPNNPGENFTNIRYYLNFDADISITIYDMAGDRVDELQDTGMAQADNETVWDLSDISSGVYFARVEAKLGGQSAVQIIKIAVIK